MRLFPVLVLLALLTMASACGQKGDLYLPESPPPESTSQEQDDP